MIINVAMCSDNFYAPFVATTMASILKNTKENVNFYIISDGIKEFNKEKIEKGSRKFFTNFSVTFVEINSSKLFSDLIELPYISRSMYSRWLIPELIPNVDRIIYTDIDVCVVGDILELWNEDIGEYCFGAVPHQRVGATSNYLEYKVRCGLELNHDVLASGLLLLDCIKWRKENIAEKLIHLAVERKLPDEEILNIYFSGNKYKKLFAKYCVIYKYLDECYTKEEIEMLTKEQVIIHYPGGATKPWNNKKLLSANFFWEVVDYTDFRDELHLKYNINSKEELVKECKKYKKIIIYGAGNFGRLVADYLSKNIVRENIVFAVSEMENNPTEILGKSVYPIREVEEEKANSLVIVATNCSLHRSMEMLLDDLEFKNVIVLLDELLNDLDYIEKS